MKKKIKRIVVFITTILVIAIITRLFIGEPCYVPSASMEPAILTGDWLWIDKLSFGGKLPECWSDIPLINIFTHIPFLREMDKKNSWGYKRLPGSMQPQVNDIIVFKSLENNDVLLVKRVFQILHIGEIIYLKDSINRPLFEQILKIEKRKNAIEEKVSGDLYTLKQNYYFVLGDNKNNSVDSRNFGCIPESLVIGKINRGIISIETKEDKKSRLRFDRIFFDVNSNVLK